MNMRLEGLLWEITVYFFICLGYLTEVSYHITLSVCVLSNCTNSLCAAKKVLFYVTQRMLIRTHNRSLCRYNVTLWTLIFKGYSAYQVRCSKSVHVRSLLLISGLWSWLCLLRASVCLTQILIFSLISDPVFWKTESAESGKSDPVRINELIPCFKSLLFMWGTKRWSPNILTVRRE